MTDLDRVYDKLFADYFYLVEGAHKEFDEHIDKHMDALELMLKRAYTAGFEAGKKHVGTPPPTVSV